MAKEDTSAVVVAPGQLEWVTLHADKQGVAVSANGKVSLLPEPLTAEDGTVSNEPQAATDSRVKGELNKIKGQVVAALGSDRMIMRVLTLPDVPDDELKGMVQLQVEKFSPFPTESLIVSHEVIARKDGNCTVIVVAALLEEIEAIKKTFGLVKIETVRIDAAVLGWRRLLKDVGGIAETGRQVVLLLTDKPPELIVFNDGLPIAFRTLAAQGDMTEDDFMAETARETGFTLMSLEMEHGPASIVAISIWHRGASSSTLIHRLNEECAAEVVAHTLDTLPSLAEGIARRAMDADVGKLVNLVPESWLMQGAAAMAKSRMITALIAIVGTWVLLMGGFFGGFYYQEYRLNRLTADYTTCTNRTEEVKSVRKRVETIQKYMDRSKSVLENMKLITSLQPTGVDLSSFAYKKSESTVSVIVAGSSGAQDPPLLFKAQLDGAKFFNDITMTGPYPDRGKQHFTIGMSVGRTTK